MYEVFLVLLGHHLRQRALGELAGGVDCEALAARYTFFNDASDPSQMVAQWKVTLPK